MRCLVRAILICFLGAHLCGFDDGTLNLLLEGAASADLPDALRRSVGAERADSKCRLSTFEIRPDHARPAARGGLGSTRRPDRFVVDGNDCNADGGQGIR